MRAAAAPAPTMLTITATDYAFELPAQVPAGVVTIHLVNNGKEIHQAQLVRLEDGKTAADFTEAMEAEGPPPTWIKFVGGPNAAVPGGSVDGSVALSQGNYVVLCFIPSPDMKPHMMKGMIHPFEVTAQAGAADHLSGETDTLTVTEYAFTQTPTLTPGHHTILVRNAGAQDHEVVLVKLPPGVTIAAFAKWTDTMKGEPPGLPVGWRDGARQRGERRLHRGSDGGRLRLDLFCAGRQRREAALRARHDDAVQGGGIDVKPCWNKRPPNAAS
mgnify:CR=1 FL=1